MWASAANHLEPTGACASERVETPWIIRARWWLADRGCNDVVVRLALSTAPVAGAVVRRGRRTFRGMSHWGQFLDHRWHLGLVCETISTSQKKAGLETIRVPFSRSTRWICARQSRCSTCPIPRRSVASPFRTCALLRAQWSCRSETHDVTRRGRSCTSLLRGGRHDWFQWANRICGGGGLFAVRPLGHSKIRLAWSRSQRIVSRCLWT